MDATTTHSEILETVDYTDDDFSTADDRVRELREQVMKNPKAKAAYDALGEEIKTRIEAKDATLRAVRKAVGLTQQQLAEELDMAQGDISRLERQQNMHLHTLARFIEATGGQLRLVAAYGDTVITLSIGDVASAEDDETVVTDPPGR